MKVDIDIETVTDIKFHEWQKDLVTGFRKGELTVMMAARQTGKSVYSQYANLWSNIMESQSKVVDIELDEGTVYGSRYYTARPVGGKWSDMYNWCTEVFGEGSRALWGEKKAPEPARRWYANNSKFWFKNEKDRDWFIVMWRS